MTKFGQQFCSKHPLKQGGDTLTKPVNPPPNSDLLMDIDKSNTMLGSSGAFGLIGSGAGSLIKTAFNVAKNPKIISNTVAGVKGAVGAIKNLISGSTKTSSTGFKPLVTGNKVYDTKSINEAFKSRFGPPTPPKKKPASTVTGSFFNTPNQLMKKAVKPPNYKKHVA